MGSKQWDDAAACVCVGGGGGLMKRKIKEKYIRELLIMTGFERLCKLSHHAREGNL